MSAFRYALNASTLFPYGLSVIEQIKVAAKAGYDGIELWVRDIERHVREGGTLGELRSALRESGVRAVNAIAFFAWADADEKRREAAFRQAEQEMRMLAELDCAAIAAPPFGEVAGVDLSAMGAAYARLCELAREIGLSAYLEFWGRAPRLSTLSEAVYAAMESGRAEAKILLDPFHMYTGGSKISGIACLNGGAIGIVHANDYPADPPRATIADRHRVMPGDGVAPLRELADALRAIGYSGYLSLELFMEDTGSLTAAEFARTGLDKMRRAFESSE